MEKALFPALFAAFAVILIAPLSSAFSFTGYITHVGDVVEVDITEPGVSLDKVNFGLKGQEGRFTIRVERVDPETVKPGAYWIYEYFFVNATGMASEPESVVMDFSVGKSWTEGENVDMKTIALSFYDKDAEVWDRLNVVELSQDSEHVYYRAEPPSLTGLFAITGEPVPVEIDVVPECDGDGICDSADGENADNCRDCLPSDAVPICIPYERTCIGDFLVMCSEAGNEYVVDECDGVCRGGECLPVADAFTGLFAEGSPLYIVIVAALVSLIAYLALSLNKIRRLINNAEQIKEY